MIKNILFYYFYELKAALVRDKKNCYSRGDTQTSESGFLVQIQIIYFMV